MIPILTGRWQTRALLLGTAGLLVSIAFGWLAVSRHGPAAFPGPLWIVRADGTGLHKIADNADTPVWRPVQAAR